MKDHLSGAATRETIRVLIADDHPVVRQGIGLLLLADKRIEVVGEAETGRDAVEMAEALRPDVILMDLMMPELDGIEATRRILERQPGMRIIILTGSERGEQRVEEAMRAGAVGYLPKKAQSEELIDGIRRAVRGRLAANPDARTTSLR